jgi:hypothetical protein
VRTSGSGHLVAALQHTRRIANRPDCHNVTLLLKLRDRPLQWALRPVWDARSVTTMDWFRSHSRLGSYLALFALAFQLALSFGHIHAHEIAPLADGSSAASTAASLLDEQHSPARPPDGQSHEHENEYCAIYAINGLISSAQNIEPPALPLPLLFSRVRLAAAAEFGLTAPSRAPFRARAPPIA